MLTEYQEQVLVIEYLELLKNRGKVVIFSALPNNLFTKSWAQKRKQIAEGLRSGFPDLCIITPKKIFFVEMKRIKGGVVSPTQKEWIKAIENTGTSIKVCKGFDEAKEFIDSQT